MDVIVLDEVHYLSDISRGTVWEEIVSTCFFWVQELIYFHSLSSYDVIIYFRLYIARKKFNLYACQQQLQIQTSLLVGLVRYCYLLADIVLMFRILWIVIMLSSYTLAATFIQFVWRVVLS